MTTDRDWEKWGSEDPYFGVSSFDRFKRQNLTEQARKEFFKTGEEHVSMILETVRKVFDSEFVPERILDFGCGVGRLLIPFARTKCHVVGVDVSSSMLREAQANLERYEIRDVELVRPDDMTSTDDGQFDLVHSFLVLQHIPWNRGKRLIDELLRHVRPGGYIAVQFYHRCNAPRTVRTLVRLRYAFKAVNWTRNLLRGRPLAEPAMQLHIYDVSLIMRSLRLAGFTDAYQLLSTQGNGEFESTILLARRKGDAQRTAPVDTVAGISS